MPPAKAACRTCNNLDPRNHLSTRYHDSPAAISAASPSPATKKRKRNGHGSSSSVAITDTRQCILNLPLDPRDLIARSEKCRFCVVLVGALDAVLDGWRDKKSLQQARVARMELELHWKGTIKILLGGGGEDAQEMVEIYSARDRDLPWPALGTSYDILHDPASDKTYEFIRLCLAKCEEKHKSKCIQRRYGEERPLRLLELQDDNVTVKLVDGSKGRYIALSHCWGSPANPPLTTTFETVQARQRGTHLDDLPPLYRDAVEIAKNLNVRLLWIDSLCIIQNSSKDWEQESATMAGIYSGAYLTIAATAARDSSDRILATRRLAKKVRYRNTNNVEFRLRTRLVQNQHQQGNHFRPAGPLMSRGWTLQESLLSSRVLHFTSTELLFECRQSCACECRPVFTSGSSLAAFEESTSLPSCSTWRKLVEKYSARSITKPEDKLTALSGLAAATRPLDNGYLAGLWTEGMPHDLLWSTAPWLVHPHRFPLPDKHRAPSWSWASIDAPVRWEPSKRSYQRKLINKIRCDKLPNFNEELLAQNAYGAVSGQVRLKLKGQLQAATLVAPDEYDFYYLLKLEGSRGAVKVFPDTLLSARYDSAGSTIGVERAKPDKSRYEPFSALVWCLAIICDDEDDTITGLVLGQNEIDDKLFVRLGLFACGRAVFNGIEQSLIIL